MKNRRVLYHRSRILANLAAACAFAGAVFLAAGGSARAAAADEVIPAGIYVGPVDVSGCTAEGAREKVAEFVKEAGTRTITLHAQEGETQTVTPGELGLFWRNPEVVDEAFSYGHRGNVVKRYKELKDLEHHTRTLGLQVALDEKKVDAYLEENADRYEQEAVDYELHRVNGEFVITDGCTGTQLDQEGTRRKILNTVSDGWDFDDAEIELVIEVQEPVGSKEQLESVKDVLGTFTTSYKSSSGARSANVENGCRLASDVTLYPGEEFSVLQHITPFTEENGYKLAASYLQGQVVDSFGGGICQVSTTLYNAVLLSELEVTERHCHSMIVSYVSPSSDAAIAESANTDFRFVNNTDTPIYIEGHTENKTMTFTIYGKETRDPGHKVRYESETLEKIEPEGENIIADGSQPAGSITIQSAHLGYKAQLWKIVEEDGKEVSREVINKSNYKLVPRTATVGTATDDPAVADRINQAIASGSIDQCKAVADAVRAGGELPEVAMPQPAPEEALPAPENPPAEAPAEENAGEEG